MAHKLIIGDVTNPSYLFEDTRIIDLVINTASDVIGDELSIDTLEASVENTDTSISDLAYGTEVTYVSASDVSSTFYLKDIQRTGPNRYTINAHSLIGMMDNEVFYGDVYTNKPLSDLVREIIQTDGLQPCNPLEYLEVNDSQAWGDIEGERLDQITGITMRDNIRFKFRYNSFQPSSAYDSIKTAGVYISGVNSVIGATNVELTKRNYGFVFVFTRSSTSVPFNQTGTLYFRYNSGVEIEIGAVSPGTLIDAEVIPSQGKLTVNGTDYTFTPVTAANNYTTPMNVIGGSALIQYSVGSIITTSYPHCVNHDLYEWKITSETGEVKIDTIPLHNTKDGKVYIRTKADGIQVQFLASVYDDAPSKQLFVPGAIPDDYRQNIIDKITYSTIASNMQITGWIPICTKREALHYVLIATGIIIKKDDQGGLLFTEPINLEFPISDSSVYMEGNVDYFQKVNEIHVEEHAFISTKPSTAYPDPVDTLWQSYAASSGTTVAIFDDPPAELGWAYSYSTGAYGLCANALLGPLNEPSSIMGFRYNHSTVLITRTIGNRPDGGVASITGVPLITAANSDNVMDRMTEYYNNAYRANLNIIKDDEMCGNKYSFTNPFNEEDSGFMTKMTEQVSAVSKGDCEFLCGYTGATVGEGYTDFVVLTGSGTWTVPASVLEKDNPQIRVYLIGGGTGGFSGLAGEAGKVNGQGQFQSRAKGGSVGASGAGGKVYSFTLTNPASTLSYACGTGGQGGAITTSTETSNAGTDGTATTLTAGSHTYTSNSGTSTPEGIANVFNNERYAMDFPTALNNWGREELDGSDYAVGVGVGGYGGYFTEEGGRYYYHQARKVIGVNFNADVVNGGAFGGWGSNNGVTGGGGGGAGYGQAGSAGTASTSSKAGNGGNGGNATATPPKVTDWRPRLFGVGGCGGGGGGAGGNSGLVYASGKSSGTAGTGGYGGKGGTGGDGCVLIYY